MNFILVCGLILCLFPFASSLKCYACEDQNSPCGDPNVKSRDCGFMEDRCFTMVMTMGPVTRVMKNCSFAAVCPESSQGNPCNQMKGSQPGMTCTFTCCEGDLCNNVTATPAQPLPSAITPEILLRSAVATADTASLASVAVPTVSSISVSADNASLSSSNTTTSPPGGNEPPSAGVPELKATFGAIFLGIVLASMAALG